MGHVLTSWKEIAQYLGKGVRTVQRWEQEIALPVRRPHEKERGMVLVSSDDIDAWMMSHFDGGNRSELEELRKEIRELKQQVEVLRLRAEQAERVAASRPYKRQKKSESIP